MRLIPLKQWRIILKIFGLKVSIAYAAHTSETDMNATAVVDEAVSIAYAAHTSETLNVFSIKIF